VSQIWLDTRQLVHCSPPSPHSEFVSPLRHVPFQSQQPLHVPGPHGPPVQVPPPEDDGVQVWPVPQAWQLAPNVPHADDEAPVWHFPLTSQQPEQFHEPQLVEEVHVQPTPPSPVIEQVWSAAHVAHALPFDPQYFVSEPGQHEGGHEL